MMVVLRGGEQAQCRAVGAEPGRHPPRRRAPLPLTLAIDPRVQLLANQEMLCAQVSQLEDDSSPESGGPSSYGGYTAEELRDLLSGQEADVRALPKLPLEVRC
mgnify:CR=1 FL=1